MKIIFVLLFGLVASCAFGQRYAYVDTEYLLGQMTEYQAAQNEIKVQVERWNLEVDEKKREIDRLFRVYYAESPLLTESMRKERMEDIRLKESQLLEWQKSHFGVGGALEKRQKELITPIQDKIFSSVQKFAREKSYDLIFDRAAGNQLLFFNSKFDKSDEILTAMGVVKKAGVAKPQSKTQQKPPNTVPKPPKY